MLYIKGNAEVSGKECRAAHEEQASPSYLFEHPQISSFHPADSKVRSDVKIIAFNYLIDSWD